MNLHVTRTSAVLGDLIDILSGFAFSSDKFGEEGELPLVRIRDVKRGWSDTYYRGDYDKRYLISDGDLLIGMDGEFNRERWTGGLALLNQRVCKVVADESRLCSQYLYHFLPEALKSIEDQTPFATVKHLSAGDIKAIDITLPPLDEQRRIAAILDKADALRRKRKRALDLLDGLTHSIFLEMFVERQPSTWESRSVSDVSLDIRTGPFGSQLLHSEFVDEGIRVLGIDNAVQNEFRWGESRFISSAKYQELRRYTVSPRDVLITIMGTCGRCAIVPDDIPVAINTKHLCCITLNQKECLPEFMHAAFLLHPSVLRQLGVQAKGAVMPGLNMGIIKALSFPLPPLEMQKQFASRVATLRQMRCEAESAGTALAGLFASLQHRAFSGQL